MRPVGAREEEAERGVGDGRMIEVVIGSSDDVDWLGSVKRRDGWCWRIRSSPVGPIPCSFSNNGDLLKVREMRQTFNSINCPSGRGEAFGHRP